MKGRICVACGLSLAFFFSVPSLAAQPVISSSTVPLLNTLDTSLQQVEQMLLSIEPQMKQLRENLTRVSALLTEARALSMEQLVLYERLLKRYEDAVSSFLILNELYKGRKTVILIEGGIIAALAVALTVSLLIR